MIDILISIAAKVGEYTVAPIGRQLGYLFSYQKNVEDFNTKIGDLKNVKERLQHEVEEAQRNGENIFDDVNDWITKVDKIIIEDHGNFIRHEEDANSKFTCGAKFPNLVLRQRLSRRAKKMAEKVATQIQDREKIKTVSYCLPPPNSVANKGYEEFESRSQTIEGIIKALRDPGVGMVGVWGMGGVGKTMLAKEVARRVIDEEKLFTKFIFITVSNDQNIKRIQQDIAEYLGMKLDEENKDIRAARLLERLKQENKILITVDDIWDKLDLEDVGISFGIHQRECKILLTTRSFHVLANDMDVDRNVIFAVRHLLEHEAMSLFHKIVGDQDEKDDDFQGLEAEIVKECGELPIAITTVASALKNKDRAVWKNALHELRKSNPTNISRMEKEVYNSIKLSFDFLESKEAKHLLLLCSLFPEDAKIEIRVLCNYGFGLNLFDVNKFEEARNKTDTLVTNLKDHSLLMDGGVDYLGNDCVKLHDVIRDVVIFIADGHHRMHNIRNADDLDKYVNDEMFKDSTAVSLYGIGADQCPQTLKTPELKLLRLESSHFGEFPSQFFEGLNKLLVLDSAGVFLEPLPAASSICLLPNLTTLHLNWCILGDISWIGELKNLKILDLSFNYSITKLPREIGNLSRLLSLNLEGCYQPLEVIEPNVISRLTRLEELNLKDSFTNWQVEGAINDDERRNASLSEVKNLSHLIDLKLRVPDINSVTKDIFGKELVKYYVCIGDEEPDWRLKRASRMLKLKLRPGGELNEHDFEALLKKSETLDLYGLKSVKSIAFEIDSMGFQCLKHLSVQYSDEIRCIVNSDKGDMDYLPAAFPRLESLFLRRLMNLENIIHEKLTTGMSFRKLRKIAVSTCHKMKSLFSLYNIPRLKEIVVEDCEMMKEIISHHGRDGILPNIQISQLQKLTLSRLPKLVQFIAASLSDQTESDKQSIEDSVSPLFNGQVEFPKLNVLDIGSLNIPKVWNDNQLPSSRFGQSLTGIYVSNCDHLKGLIPSFMIASLVHLRILCVKHCKAMEEIVFIEESAQVMANYISFPQLESLKLFGLPNLQRFCRGNISLPKLESLDLFHLLNLERLFKTNTMPVTTIENEGENSKDSVDQQHLFHHKDVVKDELGTESSCSEITCQPHPLGPVEEHHDMVFKAKLLSELRLPLMCFQNLTVLMVKDCDGLISLLSPSTAKSLSQRLTKLGISGCKSLRQVIANDQKEADDDDGIRADSINIIFRQLNSLILDDLPNLTSFYSGNKNVVLQFPYLYELVVSDCPEMKTFYHGSIECPSLHRIYLRMKQRVEDIMWDPEYYSFQNFYWNGDINTAIRKRNFYWKGDINTTIQKLWEEKNMRFNSN
ncbi:hypothetical protein FNV43_RR03598 [Rhamnella rubrinervis]|uniref:Uncharacterized protein n=1 Tax=Rhamnella rubrinervis TaxID=2594499 RepID=A0A8K0HIP6_9ROSA|nr:hypothetical protein FNV43_RR03598 [Rhamnella rubrinervis]